MTNIKGPIEGYKLLGMTPGNKGSYIFVNEHNDRFVISSSALDSMMDFSPSWIEYALDKVMNELKGQPFVPFITYDVEYGFEIHPIGVSNGQ